MFYSQLELWDTIRVPAVLMATCKTCESDYLVPSFTEFLKMMIATQLVLSKKILSKAQIKFLRQKISFAKFLGIKDTDKFYELVENRDDKAVAEIDPSALPPEADVKKMLKASSQNKKILIPNFSQCRCVK